jgi:hypothetical protein
MVQYPSNRSMNGPDFTTLQTKSIDRENIMNA